MKQPKDCVEMYKPLTDQQLSQIEQTLNNGYLSDTLIEKFKLKITQCYINTLKENNWLNDLIINFYLNLITGRSQQNTDLPRVYCINIHISYPVFYKTDIHQLAIELKKSTYFHST